MTSILDRPAPQPDSVVAYDGRRDAVVDLFLPAGPVDTLVVHLHGGFWRQRYDRTHSRPLARALADDGLLVALPEYRRVGGGPGSEGGQEGGWPTTCDDVRAAADALPGLLAEQGLVPRRVVVSGHSAGGHLALWLAATGHVADATVAVAPVGDLRAALSIGMGDGAVTDFLGGADPVDAADPAALFDAYRPAHPIRILHGTEDDNVTVENSRGLVARHPWIDLHELAGVDHFAPVDPGSASYPMLRGALQDVPQG